MGTLTAAMFMTVDGFTEKPDGTLISPAWSDDLQVHWSGATAHEGSCSSMDAAPSRSTPAIGPPLPRTRAIPRTIGPSRRR